MRCLHHAVSWASLLSMAITQDGPIPEGSDTKKKPYGWMRKYLGLPELPPGVVKARSEGRNPTREEIEYNPNRPKAFTSMSDMEGMRGMAGDRRPPDRKTKATSHKEKFEALNKPANWDMSMGMSGMFSHGGMQGMSEGTKKERPEGLPDSQTQHKWLTMNLAHEDVVQTRSGLQYKVLRHGEGMYHPTPESVCQQHFIGMHIDGTPFDSSRDRGDPTNLAPMKAKMAGTMEAMLMMVEGDHWELYLPSKLALGDQGTSDGVIQGGDVLIIRLELINIDGDKRPRTYSCDLKTLRHCSDIEADFLETWKGRPRKEMQKEIDRLYDSDMDVEPDDHVSREMIDWKILMMETLYAKQASLPKVKAEGVSFIDVDGDMNEIAGRVKIRKAEDETTLDGYSLHFGLPNGRRCFDSVNDKDSLLQYFPKTGRDISWYIPKNTLVPAKATQLLVLTRGKFGEMARGATTVIIDALKPCVVAGEASCGTSVTAMPDTDPDADEAETQIMVSPANDTDRGIDSYKVYWGRGECSKVLKNTELKNGPIGSASADESINDLIIEVPADSLLPEGTTHILVFPKNKYGESDLCKSTPFQDNIKKSLAEFGKRKSEL
eukprot:gnl/MRDRNA2_/MRDRNA2_121371_c0_seq1.p1 gnl/MRDRNA2_/MRDRNA2_121371_c0~~gnl/MRDRNA2_/MRDRNA2_121371_c0_seq1.p1  ORF type:complete len:605 (+),score=100.85 gnl/MRDRNA2_/MRDRNA2_121371_c0_seq1:107-1921(+)